MNLQTSPTATTRTRPPRPRAHLLAAVLLGALAATACGGDDAAPDDNQTVTSCEVTAPSCDATDIEGQLACVPGLTATRNEAGDTGGPTPRQRFDLTLEQPIDHADLSVGTFTQHAVLYVAGAEAPMVFYTSGYHLGGYLSEPALIFGTNQIEIEHRFFGPSTPSPRDWSKLTIRQQALDEHRWVRALRFMFPGGWINTGGSKGGKTATFHRKLSPCDFDGTLAYVAPFTPQLADPRYEAFLNQVGGDEQAACRASWVEFQRLALTRRDDIVPLMGGTYAHLGSADVAFEHLIIEAPWAFWQYIGPDYEDYNCETIPDETASDEEILDYLDVVVGIDYLVSDATIEDYAAYYYQAATQLGDYLPPESLIADLLRYPGTDTSQTYAPKDVDLPYDNSAVIDTLAWVADEATDIAFIYGEFDPWTAGAIAAPTRTAVQKYEVARGNHGAGLFEMAPEDRATLMASLSTWLGTPPVIDFANAQKVMAPARVPHRAAAYDPQRLRH
ncbi:MAG: hypothetical protein IPL79_00855 [Myxococcales bacterium]|nr:hypothetical protein [Myxococcales bacterium]